MAYETPVESRTVKDFLKACEKTGLPGTLTETFGGSDNNSFAKHGIEGLVLSCGMYQASLPQMNITKIKDLYDGAELIHTLIEL